MFAIYLDTVIIQGREMTSKLVDTIRSSSCWGLSAGG